MRLLWVLVSSLTCACLVQASAWLPASEAPTAAVPASTLELLFSGDAASTRKLLSQACERDVHLTRLLIELSAGASSTDGARQTVALTRLLGGDVRLFVERAGELSALPAGGSFDTRLSREQLERAQLGRGVVGDQPPVLLDACAFGRGPLRLWVARSQSVMALLQDAQIDARQVEVVDTKDTRSADHGVLLPRLDGGANVSVRPLVRAPDDTTRRGAFLALTALGALLGGVVAFAATRAQPVDESVLAAIETATERVAQGDLSSQISLSVTGRADQTLRSFDRMTHELRETRAKLKEAERAAAWQDMAQRIAHEIKNPLSPIKLALETMRKAHEKRLRSFDEIFEESTRAMLEEVARMEHIVREFSDFARLPKARPGALSLSRLVHDTVALYAPEGVELTIDAPDDGVDIHADREQLVQVVVNLLANADDATRDAGSPHIAVGIAREGDQVAMWVDDNGPGIAERDRARIFEPYVTGKERGTGLGLAIAQRIVQDHGGNIVATASPLGGARFVLKLPSATARQSHP